LAVLERTPHESISNAETPRHAGRRLPRWLKRPLPDGPGFGQTVGTVALARVATVCQEARCPNRPECWSHHVVTFMIMGKTCTRHCAFCAVGHGTPDPLDAGEPTRLAEAAATLGARHVVITSVTRDDLPDEGAAHFAATVAAVRDGVPAATVEVLTPDMHARRECIERIGAAAPAVYNHNIETVERLTPAIRPQADYRRSLEVLRIAGRCQPDLLTKSGLLIGMGETRDEIDATLADLRAAGCDIVTIGQYLQPTPGHWGVDHYWHPDEFEAIGDHARRLGFASVVCGPFVRSSYHASQAAAAAASSRQNDRPDPRTETRHHVDL
jgi:lipoyl synthase